jgi:hypothetical protein
MFKSIIEDQRGIRSDQQCLMFAGTQLLEGMRTLADYNIMRRSSLSMR